jgi:predicted transposase YbfD/YdcC
LAKQSPLAESIEHDSDHGRINRRQASLHDLSLLDIDDRWQYSGLRTLIAMTRETFELSSQKDTGETAYYLSNYQDDNRQHALKTLTGTIRGHWGVESNNWQLDVTFGEDAVRTKHGNQAQIMGKLRCFSMNLLCWAIFSFTLFQASIEMFTDSPESLISMLKQVNFL